jgi:hypothetical protein
MIVCCAQVRKALSLAATHVYTRCIDEVGRHLAAGIEAVFKHHLMCFHDDWIHYAATIYCSDDTELKLTLCN